MVVMVMVVEVVLVVVVVVVVGGGVGAAGGGAPQATPTHPQASALLLSARATGRSECLPGLSTVTIVTQYTPNKAHPPP